MPEPQQSECLACGFSNPAGFNYCGNCGQPLKGTCAHCGFQSAPDATHCEQCGAALGGVERRQLTVMFCDLVESTSLSERLDPEELREIIAGYQSAAGEVIDRYEGHVAQYLGDGLLVYFGYPKAHEDDARRAVLAGLEIVKGMEALNSGLEGERDIRLAVRVGIHTGQVVLGEVGKGSTREQLAIGSTPNIAARVQGLVGVDAVGLTESTHRLVRGFFEFDSLGQQSLKGLSRPVAIYRAIGETGVTSTFQVVSEQGLAPMVGREDELGALLDRFTLAGGGDGQVALISAEAGVGKSRLVESLRERLDPDAAAWIVARCSAFRQNSPLHPLLEPVQGILGIERGEPAEESLGKIERAAESHGLRATEMVPLLANLLSLPLDGRYAPLDLAPQLQRQMTLETIFELMTARAVERPLILVIEDLHWIDPSTLDFIELVLNESATTPLLALLTYRLEFQPPWKARENLTRISLGHLGKKDAQKLVLQLTGGKRLPRDVMDQVLEKTDGVPLFVEELVQTILESGELEEHEDRYELVGSRTSVTIPATLQDSLMARLDRLGSPKFVAQLGAILGRDFSYELIRSIWDRDEDLLRRDLTRLVDAGILLSQEQAGRPVFSFRHALIQDAAYRALLRKSRRSYHEKVAGILVVDFGDIAEGQPEIVAYHYTEAGLAEPGIEYWLRAGRRGLQRFADVEASRHLEMGLELLESLPTGSQRDLRELELLSAMGPALMAVQGFATPEVKRVFTRAQELSQNVDESQELFWILNGLWYYQIVSGGLKKAAQTARRMTGLTESASDYLLRMASCSCFGAATYMLGELAPARESFEQGISLDPDDRFQVFELGGVDPGVMNRSHLGIVLWLQGFPDQAVSLSESAVELARRLRHPFTLIQSLLFRSWVHGYRREPEEAWACAFEALNLAEEKGSWSSVQARIVLGSVLAAFDNGDAPESVRRGAKTAGISDGLQMMRQGIGQFSASGAKLSNTFHLALLTRAYLGRGKTEEGLDVVNEALELADAIDEKFLEAELYRLKGELLYERSPDKGGDAVEECFRRAVETAVRHGARSLELRAATSLARFCSRAGNQDEGRRLLGEVAEAFEEGFETGDLLEARATVRRLS